MALSVLTQPPQKTHNSMIIQGIFHLKFINGLKTWPKLESDADIQSLLSLVFYERTNLTTVHLNHKPNFCPSNRKNMIENPFLKSTMWILLMTLIFVQAMSAQTTREVLTNVKIIELVRLGLGEDIIVEKIRQSQCQCDTSTAGLAKLQAAKVPNSIIMAMLNSASGDKPYSESGQDKPVVKPTQTNTAKDIGLSRSELSQMSEPGIYLNENGKITAIEPTIYSGTKANMLGTVFTYGIKKTKIRAVVRGKSANTQVSTARPEFYFLFSREYGNAASVMSGIGGYAATSPAEFVMVSMTIKENSREATMGSVSLYNSSTGASDKDIREFKFDKIKPGLYKVTPKIDLATGEYCFYYAGNSGAGNKVFDFSVK